MKTREMTHKVNYTDETGEETQIEFTGIAFYHDNGHKFYVIENEQQLNNTVHEMLSYGYKVMPINEIKETFINCKYERLKFIYKIEDNETIIPQFTTVTQFEGIYASSKMDIATDLYIQFNRDEQETVLNLLYYEINNLMIKYNNDTFTDKEKLNNHIDKLKRIIDKINNQIVAK